MAEGETVARDTQVGHQIKRIGEITISVGEHLNRVEKMLEPILRGEPSVAKEPGGKPGEKPLCPLAEVLRTSVRKLENYAGRLDKIIRTIEL